MILLIEKYVLNGVHFSDIIAFFFYFVRSIFSYGLRTNVWIERILIDIFLNTG